MHRRAGELLGKVVPPKAVRGHRGDGRRGAAGAARRSGAGVSESGYYDALTRPPSVRAFRHAWLTDQIREVHAASAGTYGARRVHAELTLGRAVVVSHGAIELLMSRAGIRGVTGRPRWRRPRARAHRERPRRPGFARSGPNQLWVADIERHEALSNRAVVEGHPRPVRRSGPVKLRAARLRGCGGERKQP
jgi:hypothetical protein